MAYLVVILFGSLTFAAAFYYLDALRRVRPESGKRHILPGNLLWAGRYLTEQGIRSRRRAMLLWLLAVVVAVVYVFFGDSTTWS